MTITALNPYIYKNNGNDHKQRFTFLGYSSTGPRSSLDYLVWQSDHCCYKNMLYAGFLSTW